MTLIHDFEQAPNAPVRICAAYLWFGGLCGKWPDHHMHTDDKTTCSCEACMTRSAEIENEVEALESSEIAEWHEEIEERD